MPNPHAPGDGPLDYRTELAASLARLMGTWWAPSFHAALARSVGVDLGATASRVLWELAFVGAVRPSELADRIGIGAPSISKATAALATRGWVERSVDDADRRLATLRLTNEGLEVARSLIDVGDRMLETITEGWSVAETEEATRVTTRLAEGAARFAETLRD